MPDISLAERLLAQGRNPQTVFADLAPALYALNFRDGGYARQSDFCAALAAAALGGLEGKNVLDLGCGYGTTTLALSAWHPAHITAVDSSAPMVEFMRAIFKDTGDLGVWMERNGAATLLRSLGFYKPVLEHFRTMRRVFQGGSFALRDGRLRIFREDSLWLDWLDIDGIYESFDAIVGNNFFHWPVNQRVGDMLKAQPRRPREDIIPIAVADALAPLRRRVRRGPVVLMEPADFITLDDNPAFDRYIEEHGMTAHPFYLRFQAAVNDILWRDYGVERTTPKRTTLFRRSELPKLMERGGFRLEKMHHLEAAYVNDPFEVCLSRLPMNLGGVSIPFEEKVAVMKKVREALRGTRTEAEAKPSRVHWFYLVLTPLD